MIELHCIIASLHCQAHIMTMIYELRHDSHDAQMQSCLKYRGLALRANPWWKPGSFAAISWHGGKKRVGM